MFKREAAPIVALVLGTVILGLRVAWLTLLIRDQADRPVPPPLPNETQSEQRMCLVVDISWAAVGRQVVLEEPSRLVFVLHHSPHTITGRASRVTRHASRLMW